MRWIRQIGRLGNLTIEWTDQRTCDMKGEITYVIGDATAPTGGGERIICHVCNDIGGWGRGFVTAISKRWPEPEARYRAWHGGGEAGDFGLGTIQIVGVEPSLSVANMVAQEGTRPKNGVPPIRYEALRNCLAKLADHASVAGASVHMPRIGCGLAGGTWPEVEAIVNSTLCKVGVPVVVYDFEPAWRWTWCGRAVKCDVGETGLKRDPL